jgi:hypothetical protein
LKIYTDIPVSTTLHVRIYDDVSATIVLTGDLGSNEAKSIWTVDSVSGLAESVRPFYVNLKRFAGAATFIVYSIVVYGY